MSLVGRITFTRTKGFSPRAMGNKLQEAVDGASLDTASAIETDVKGGGPHAAPYKTGNLRRSYHIDFSKVREHIWMVGNDPRIANYAIFLELGTRFMAARPHLVPALEAQRDKFMERVRAHLGRV